MSRARYWQWHCHAWPLLTIALWRRVYGLQSHTVLETRLSLYLDLVFQTKTFVNCHDVILSFHRIPVHIRIPH